jgi:lauroyl/myristoyl acyltransferase
VSCFIERRGGKQYLRFNEPMETRRDDDPVALTALMTADIEEQIRRVPEQWVWMHRRWRERPEWEV